MDGGGNLYLHDIQRESFDYYGSGQSGRGIQIGEDTIGGGSDDHLEVAKVYRMSH